MQKTIMVAAVILLAICSVAQAQFGDDPFGDPPLPEIRAAGGTLVPITRSRVTSFDPTLGINVTREFINSSCEVYSEDAFCGATVRLRVRPNVVGAEWITLHTWDGYVGGEWRAYNHPTIEIVPYDGALSIQVIIENNSTNNSDASLTRIVGEP